MHQAIRQYVLPLVDRIKVKGFDKNNFKHIINLSDRLTELVNSKNVKEIEKCLAFCIQEFPDLTYCPIDAQLIKRATQIIDR